MHLVVQKQIRPTDDGLGECRRQGPGDAKEEIRSGDKRWMIHRHPCHASRQILLPCFRCFHAFDSLSPGANVKATADYSVNLIPDQIEGGHGGMRCDQKSLRLKYTATM